MKKSHVIIAVILIALSTSGAFAQTSDYYGEVSPRYSYIMDITPVLVIDNEGNSAATIDVYPIDLNTVDRVTATVTLRNIDNGRPVATWRDMPLVIEPLYTMYNLDLTYRLPIQGTYIMEATISLYHGNTLRERVSVTSNIASF